MKGLRRLLIIITTLIMVLGLAAFNSSEDASEEA
jgi:hypothetical protein